MCHIYCHRQLERVLHVQHKCERACALWAIKGGRMLLKPRFKPFPNPSFRLLANGSQNRPPNRVSNLPRNPSPDRCPAYCPERPQTPSQSALPGVSKCCSNLGPQLKHWIKSLATMWPHLCSESGPSFSLGFCNYEKIPFLEVILGVQARAALWPRVWPHSGHIYI